MILSEYIENLKQFPQNLEVWGIEDESCTYHKRDSSFSDIKPETIGKYYDSIFKEDTWRPIRWIDGEKIIETKTVLVL